MKGGPPIGETWHLPHLCCSNYYGYWVPVTFDHNSSVSSLSVPRPSPVPVPSSQTGRLSELIYMILEPILLSEILVKIEHCNCVEKNERTHLSLNQ